LNQNLESSQLLMLTVSSQLLAGHIKLETRFKLSISIKFKV
jgi:hypothetical protein